VAYSRYANLLEQRGEVQRSLTAFKKAYQHQLQGNRGDME
jgi:HTH-type transcriptional regulator, quorum sensing regulator NprR